MFRRNESRIIDVIYKKVKGDVLSAAEEKTFNKWMKGSIYYQALMDEIGNDEILRTRLLDKYVKDKLDFWTEVITYRTAMHGNKPKRRGFFSFFR